MSRREEGVESSKGKVLMEEIIKKHRIGRDLSKKDESMARFNGKG